MDTLAASTLHAEFHEIEMKKRGNDGRLPPSFLNAQMVPTAL